MNALKAISNLPFTDLESDGVDLSSSLSSDEMEEVLMGCDRPEITETGSLRCVSAFDSSLYVDFPVSCRGALLKGRDQTSPSFRRSYRRKWKNQDGESPL